MISGVGRPTISHAQWLIFASNEFGLLLKQDTAVLTIGNYRKSDGPKPSNQILPLFMKSVT